MRVGPFALERLAGMLRVGLTGGIGAGKSVVAARLAEQGAVVLDADRIAREVIDPGTPGLAAVVSEFGTGVLGPDGGVDRARLAEVVFADPAARRALEGIIHPLVRRRTEELTVTAADDAVVVNDVPLLTETGLAPGYHLVVVVSADPAVRERRLAGRGMDAEQARARIAAQATDAQRAAVADAPLDNSGTLDDLHRAVDALWADRLVPFERNVREHRPVHRPETPRLADPDASWPDRFRRHAARLSRALGDRALRIDHIGSTSVPGLIAKDVIDIQVVVAGLATADELADDLAGAGYPRYTGEWWDTAPPGWTGPTRLIKRFHGGADPADVVQVHVREESGPAWRHALAFRDWLRANPADRDGYAAEKRRLAAAVTTTSAYADAKEPWFGPALRRAGDWAAATGWHPSDDA